MKSNYYIARQGYTVHPEDPGFDTRTEARKNLRSETMQELRNARSAGWKSAAIIAKGPDHRAIHASRSEDSPMWARLSVTTFA
jgi:hypothetical protein